MLYLYPEVYMLVTTARVTLDVRPRIGNHEPIFLLYIHEFRSERPFMKILGLYSRWPHKPRGWVLFSSEKLSDWRTPPPSASSRAVQFTTIDASGSMKVMADNQ